MTTQPLSVGISIEEMPFPAAVFAPAVGTTAWVRVEANAAFLEAFSSDLEVPPGIVPLLEDLRRSSHAAALIGANGGPWWEARATPLRIFLKADGAALVTLLDVTGHVVARREAEKGKAAFDALMEHVPEGITVADAPDVTIRQVSAHGIALTQRDEASLTGIGALRHPDTWQVFHRDGVTRASADELPLTRATVKGEVVNSEVWMLRRPDGSLLPILCNAGPIKDADGNPTGGVIAWRDMTDIFRVEEELRRAIESRDLLLHELDHRLKNQLALVQGLISITAQSSSTPAVMAGKLRGRLNALAQALDFIRAGGIERQAGHLHDLLAGVLVPFTNIHSSRIAIECDVHMSLGLSAASTLALAIHELATNAEKYGALSTKAGRVRISCRSEPHDMLAIHWEETGGPATSGSPTTQGFGSRLLLQAARQIGGKVSVDWSRTEGIVVEIVAPTTRLAAH